MRSVTSFNADWQFHEGFSQALSTTRTPGGAVTLPHTAVELPFNYFDETSYQRPFTYQKVIHTDAAWSGREVSVVFDGAMADAVVNLNGKEIAAHKDGYTPFEARLTGLLRPGENLLSVKIDGSENPNIPPFGGRIDYLTYAGIYRDVWLRVTAPVYVANSKIETPDALAASKTVTIRADVANPQDLPLSGTLTAALRDRAGKAIASASADITGPSISLRLEGLTGIALWQLNDPRLYTVELTLETPHGADQTTSTFGFRTAEFTTKGFFLNGKLLKLRGLNRHQAFPYTGYAMGRAAQEADAEILKRDLKVNMVRTSHYPQSKWFLDHCDRIGLLVFEEIPGWQHIGDEAWQAESIENVRRMITRDWNHPSIVIWGVRINESQDNHDFYAATNTLARELDSTRQTGGVRYITDSELLEDVYTMNDFIHAMHEIPGWQREPAILRPVRENTGLGHDVPYLITEYMGHMFPTKSFDQEQRQLEHVTRHLQILDAMYGDPQISGAIGWCMFDYNTHKDFGSGDRICYHGVLDMFREPKYAAFAYSSQADATEGVVLKPVSLWARGERNIGGVLPLMVLTNCDEVELVFGSGRSKRGQPARRRFPHLPHPPVIFEQADFDEPELGMWGDDWKAATIVGYLDGKAVQRIEMMENPLPTTLEVVADRQTLSATDRDQVRVIVRALDQGGQKLMFLRQAVNIEISGPAKLIGPSTVPLSGGSTGFWVQATGAAGTITATVTCPQLGTTTLTLSAA